MSDEKALWALASCRVAHPHIGLRVLCCQSVTDKWRQVIVIIMTERDADWRLSQRNRNEISSTNRHCTGYDGVAVGRWSSLERWIYEGRK